MNLNEFNTILAGISMAHDVKLNKIKLTNINYQPSVNLLKIETESADYEISIVIRENKKTSTIDTVKTEESEAEWGLEE